jgi:hypothetical protein
VFTLSFVISNSSLLFAQQPQAPAGTPLYSVNAKYVNGMAPGYWATAGSGLTLSLSAGTAYCGNPPAPVSYPGGSLLLTASTANYIYLDPANNCAPTAGTSAFTAGEIPIATVVTSASSITSIADARTWFMPQPCATGAGGDVHCSSRGSDQNILLTPSGSGASVITNLADKGGQVFNVKAYGATGDGSTDDTADIEAAVASAEAVHGTVYFPPGTYKTTSTLSLPSNTGLLGAGSDRTLLKYAGTGVGFSWSGVLHDSIEHLAFDCSTGPASSCVQLTDSSSDSTAYVHFSDNAITGGTYCMDLYSSYVYGVLWNSFYAVNFDSCGTHALYLHSTGSGFVNENTFQMMVLRASTNTQTLAYVQGRMNLFLSVDASGMSGSGGVGYAFVSGVSNVILGGDVESDETCVTFDSNSNSNKIIGTDGFGGVVDNSSASPSGNDLFLNTWNRVTNLEFRTPSFGTSSGGIDFYDSGNIGHTYEYMNSSAVRFGTDRTGSNDRFRIDLNNGNVTVTQGLLLLGAHTVSGLETAGPANAGAIAKVTDSTTISTEGQTCAGGGSTVALAFSDGSNWKCF